MTDRRSVTEELGEEVTTESDITKELEKFPYFQSKEGLKTLISLGSEELERFISSLNNEKLEEFIDFYSKCVVILVRYRHQDDEVLISNAIRWLVQHEEIAKKGLKGQAFLSMQCEFFYTRDGRVDLNPGFQKDLDRVIPRLFVENFDLLEFDVSIDELMVSFDIFYDRYNRVEFKLFDSVIFKCCNLTAEEIEAMKQKGKNVSKVSEEDIHINSDITPIIRMVMKKNIVREFIEYCYSTITRDQGFTSTGCEMIGRRIGKYLKFLKNRLDMVSSRFREQKQRYDKDTMPIEPIKEKIKQNEEELEKCRKAIEALEQQQQQRQQQLERWRQPVPTGRHRHPPLTPPPPSTNLNNLSPYL